MKSNDYIQTRHLHNMKENWSVVIGFRRDYKQKSMQTIAQLLDKRTDLSDKVSEEYLEKEFERILIAAYRTDETDKRNFIANQAETFLANIRPSDKLVYTRILNVYAKKQHVIGDLTILPDFAALSNHCKSKGITSDLITFMEPKNQTSGNSVFIEVKVRASDDQQIKKEYLHKANEVLNLFRIFVGDVPKLEGETGIRNGHFSIYDETTKSMQSSLESNIGDFVSSPLLLDNFFLNDPFIKLTSLFGDIKRTQMQQKIFKAIYWLGESQKEHDKHVKLVQLITSLESLLIEGCEKKCDTIKERLPKLLIDDETKRKEIEKTIKDAYGLRDDILHDGRRRFIKEKLLYDLRACSLGAIFKVADKNLSDFSALKNELQNKK
ncbi:Uncharacterised protein [Candidatus Anstonella stagnisolia]|nr:Uncharacterised protein [Candidatus Anstonella stagnisolia]